MSEKNTTAPASGSGGTPAACTTGSCPCKPIASISLVSLTFRSDHDLLKDYSADWKDGGSRFSKPEWTAGQQHPVSHTMDKKVTVEVELEVAPPDACQENGILRGEGPDSMVFEKNGVAFKAGKFKLELTSDLKVPKKIQDLIFQVKWTTQATSAALSATTSNVMYVTMDNPTTPRQPGVTLKRMRHAVRATGGANSLNPHDIVKHVMSTWSSFNLSQVYDNEWELADDTRYPSGHPKAGQLVGADCQTIVRHTESVIRMVGCPGTSEFIVVWAKVPTPLHGEENLAYAPNVSNPKQWHNAHKPPDPLKATWRATLLDHGGGKNRYEACLRFEHGGLKKYYAGGVGALDNANQVIKVFKTMSWVDDNTLDVKGVIHPY